jgi:hypothetical protein
MKAFETTGKVNKNGQLLLDEPLNIDEHSKVKVIVLVSEKPEYDLDDTPVEEIKHSLRNAFQEVKEGQTLPISELWENINAQ